MRVGKAAAYTGLSANTLRRKVQEGRLTAYRPDNAGQLRFLASDLDALMVPVGGEGPGTAPVRCSVCGALQ